MRKTEAQRDNRAIKRGSWGSNSGRPTLLCPLSSEETVKAKVLEKERLTASSEPAGFENISCSKQLQKRLQSMAVTLPPPAGGMCLLQAFDGFVFNKTEGALSCRAMITKISAKS